MAEVLGIGSRVEHPSFGKGVVVEVKSDAYSIYFPEEEKAKDIGKEYGGLEVLERTEPDANSFDISEMEDIMHRVISSYIDPPKPIALGGKWLRGMVTIKPGDPNMASKEIPIDAFFHKIVMVRDRLRVLEQNINTHEKLDDEDRVHLQQYITRAYGSLTTFNVLFNDKSAHFKGAGKST